MLARKTLESDVFFRKPHVWFKIWVSILLLANHKDIKQFKRGETFTNYQELCHYSKATQNEVDHCIRWLKQARQIATRKATRGFYIKVLNYDLYQKTESYKSDTKSDSSGERKAKHPVFKSDTINKNDVFNNNEKNGAHNKFASNEARKAQTKGPTSLKDLLPNL